MTVLLVANTGPATGADFTVAANTAFVLSVFTAPGDIPGPSDSVSLDLKTDNGNYQLVGVLTKGSLVAVLPPVGGAVTYRLRRTVALVALGVDGR